MVKKILLILILLLAGCSNNFGADLKKPIVEKTLKEVPVITNEIGDFTYRNYFEDDNGVVHEIFTTKGEYESLAEKGAGQPSYKGMKWVGSSAGKQIEYEVPILKDGEYTVFTDKDGMLKTFIKETGKTQKETNFDYIEQNYEKIIDSDNRTVDIISK